MEERQFRIGAGKVNIEIQENTEAHYVSRWAATLIVRKNGSVIIEDGRPHENQPTGRLKVNGRQVLQMQLKPGDVVTVSDRFQVPWQQFCNCFSPEWKQPKLLVDEKRQQQFEDLHTVERKFEIWSKVENIATRYAFMSLTPLIWGIIRTVTDNAPFNPIFAIATIALTLLCVAVLVFAGRKRAAMRELYRCPHCGRRLSSGKRLRNWDELEEDNRCPRCSKSFCSC